MRIPGALLDQLIAHAREREDVECCGLVAVEPASDGEQRMAVRVYPTENIHASPLRFEIDPMEQYRLTEEIEERGWEIGAIYHSHVRSAPYPSQTDISFAANLPGVEWIIVGLAGAHDPEVRSYLIEDAGVHEVELRRER